MGNCITDSNIWRTDFPRNGRKIAFEDYCDFHESMIDGLGFCYRLILEDVSVFEFGLHSDNHVFIPLTTYQY